MSMAFPTAGAGLQRMLAGSLAVLGALAALCLAGCVNTRTTTTGLISANSPDTPIVTESDESSIRRRARLRMELAAGYFEHGQTTVALDEIKQALNADPNYADAFALRGLVYMRLEDAGLAEDSFRRALALNPRDGNTRHNYGWLLCQQNRYRDAAQQFEEALNTPGYNERGKTLMTKGLCEMRAGQNADAERTLMQAYEIDAGNPVVGYNLASLLAQREEWSRAQFYVRRVNNGAASNAETLWLGIRIERRLNNREAMAQLGEQLQRRFPQSREAQAFERGNFND